jgi:hypothetical protein
VSSVPGLKLYKYKQFPPRMSQNFAFGESYQARLSEQAAIWLRFPLLSNLARSGAQIDARNYALAY